MKRNKITVDSGTLADVELLQKTREWRALTPKQQVFVTVFLTTGDAPHAMAAAYPTSSVLSRRSFQWQVLRAQAVQEFLEIWKWRNSREALISICREQLAAAAPGSVAAGKFSVQLERLILGVQGSNKAHFEDPNTPKPEPLPPVETGTAAPVFTVGMRVTERDAAGILHVGIVKALDATGIPCEVEEVK